MQEATKDRGIGDEPNNSIKCSEVADGVARKSEGIARLSFLCTVRQGVSERCSGVCLRTLQSEWWSSGSGQPDFRENRTVWRGTVVGRTGARAEKSNLSTAACAAGVHTQAGWEAETVRHTDNPGSVQTAAVLVLEPIFEADLQPEQYAYRADRSALDAVQRVHKLINTGHGQIVDADLSSYFDSVPHAELMRSVARRVVDGAMLHLIKMWLEAPVEETDERGNLHRSTRNRDEGRGSPQGCTIRLLINNLYMRRFVLGWKKLGHEERWRAYIVNYADDLVICCRVGAEQALAAMRVMMSKLKLTVNESKTRVCYLPEVKFDFLGYTFGRCYSMRKGRVFLGTVPSKKRVQRICRVISDETGRDKVRQDSKTVVEKLNRMMIGWANYFCLGPVSKAYNAVDTHARRRLRRWLCDKHNEPRPAYKRFPEASLHSVYGLVQLPHRTASLPWAKA